jgi:hypothetical protein
MSAQRARQVYLSYPEVMSSILIGGIGSFFVHLTTGSVAFVTVLTVQRCILSRCLPLDY